jgi:hypothetical protein
MGDRGSRGRRLAAALALTVCAGALGAARAQDGQPKAPPPSVGTAQAGATGSSATAPTRAIDPDPTATDVKIACAESFTASQKLRRDGQLVAARREALVCAQERCPEVIRPVCALWLRELEPLIPSVVVVAKDAAGNDTAKVRVYVDGRQVDDELSGKPIVLDPGPHLFRFEHGDRPPIEKRLILAQGQTSRVVDVSFAPAAPVPSARQPAGAGGSPPPDATERGGISPVAWAGFGLAALGLTVGTVTGVMTLSNSSVLQENCAGGVCQPEDYGDLDATYALAHASTASFAVAGVGAIVGVVALLVSRPRSETPVAASGLPLRPVLGMGTLGVRGELP